LILVDVNILVYAHVASFREHEQAKVWLDSRLGGPTPVGLPWESLLGFVRLVSNPRIFERPETVVAAWGQAREWLSSPVAWIPLATERHADLLNSFLGSRVSRANHVPDAHLAALAVEHGLTLCSTDGDFARFPGLRWENPLA
jgi:toxin-antitoxin system PIN domain toxin